MNKAPSAQEGAQEQPLTTRERLAYSMFNGADYLIKNIIGKYMFFLCAFKPIIFGKPFKR